MQRFHLIENNVIINTVVAESADAFGQLDGVTLVPALEETITPEPAPVPETISDRQMYHQLAVCGETVGHPLYGMVSKPEALAAVKTGELPAALAAFVAGLPESYQFDAEMLLSGAVEFRRHHQMTLALGQAFGLSNEQLDDFFRSAHALG